MQVIPSQQRPFEPQKSPAGQQREPQTSPSQAQEPPLQCELVGQLGQVVSLQWSCVPYCSTTQVVGQYDLVFVA